MKRTIFALTLLGILSSCAKEQFEQPYTGLSISASVETQPDSKSYMPSPGTEVKWTKNDRLFVFGIKTGDIKQVMLSPKFNDACATGVFGTDSWPEGYTPIYALNSNGAIDTPSELTCTSDGIMRAYVNPVQKIANTGSYGQSASASVGSVSEVSGNYTVSEMKNIPSLLRFSVSREDITEVKIEALGDEYLAGYVDVDYAALSASEPEFWSVSKGEKTIVVTPSGSSAKSGCFLKSITYCACVLPQTYEQGFKITMTASDGKIGVREIAKSLAMPRSVVRAFSKAIDDGVEFKDVRTIKVLDFSTVGGSTFNYDDKGTAKNLPQRTAGYIPDTSSFWGVSYPLYKFLGAVRYWNTGGGALNMAANTYVRFPRISGYKLTSITDVKVVHSGSRNYKITSSSASSYADGIPVKGGEEQSLSSSSAATSFVLKDKYEATKDYYIVCSSEAGFRFKLVYTPDDQLDPEPSGSAPVSVARWRIKKTDLTQSKMTTWKDANSFPALSGDYANEAFISTSNGPVRTSESDQLAIGNINSGDAVMFTIPVKDLASGSGVDFMTTLRAESPNIPKYWIFEYYDGDEWKSVNADLKTASDASGLKYSLFLPADDDLLISFCQNFTISNAISGEGQLKMRLRAVGSINCNGGTISPSANACLCFATYSNYYVGCEIAIYRGINVKDTNKVLFVGNSYTYYNGSYFMLKEIARSQGHDLRLRATIKGGVDMSEHINLVHVQEAMAEGGYNYAFIQESALYVAKYFDGNRDATYTNCKAVIDKIRQYTAAATCSIEDCWSSPTDAKDWRGYGSYAQFQRSLLGGALKIANQATAWITPVGIAFQRAYEDGFTDLWSTADYTHPSLFGSYLKACTFYYLLYGDELDANVPDCGISAATAAKLRAYARSAVMEKGNRAKCMAPDVKDVDTF